jgi:hypothetical protein
MPYVNFTDEQKRFAASVNLEDFLRRQGEKLTASGGEKRMASDHSVTIRGSRWYDHATGEGGGAVSFVRKRYNLPYPDAVKLLLGGTASVSLAPIDSRQNQEAEKQFELPPKHSDMRRLYAYLLNQRFIDRDIVAQFAREGLLYESCERSRDGAKEFHNAVFVGYDERGAARHAHKRGLYSEGKAYKGNVYGSNPSYSFHRVGTSERLFAFEAPVDLLSCISLYQRDWLEDSYVALCGTSEHALLKTLELNPHLKRVTLCLDNDSAGIAAAAHLEKLLRERGYDNIAICRSRYKDWNEDLRASKGLDAVPARENPQVEISREVFERMARTCEQLPQSLRPERKLVALSRKFAARPTAELAEDIAALSLFMAARELRQQGERVTPRELAERLTHAFAPSRVARSDSVTAALNRALELSAASGIRSAAQKAEQAAAWLNAVSSSVGFAIALQAGQAEMNASRNNFEMKGFDL